MKTPLQKFRGLALAVLAITAFALPAHAALNVGITSVNPDSVLSSFGIDGWKFTVIEDIRVTGLGVYNYALTDEDYTVSIWNASGQTILSASVNKGTATLLNGFYYKTGPLLELNAGSSYWVGVTYGAGKAVAYDSSWTPATASEISYQGQGSSSDTETNPTTANNSGDLKVTANFTYEAIPEPSTFALIGSGVAALLVLRRRKA